MVIPFLARAAASGGKFLGSVGKKGLGSLRKEVNKIGNKREYISNFIGEYGGEQLKTQLNENGVIENNSSNLELIDEKKKEPEKVEEILEVDNKEDEENEEENSKLPNPLSKAKIPKLNKFPVFGGISLLILLILFIVFSVKKVETGDGEEVTRMNLMIKTLLGKTEFSGNSGGDGEKEEESLSSNLLDKYKENLYDNVIGVPWLPTGGFPW